MVETNGNPGEGFADVIGATLVQEHPVGAEAFDPIVLRVSQANVMVVQTPIASLVQLGRWLHADRLVRAQVIKLIAPALETAVLRAVVG